MIATVHLDYISVKKAGGPAARAIPVDHLVGGAVVEGVVEAEGLVLQVAGQVHLLLGLVDHHHVLAGDGDHVQVLCGQL